MILFPLWCFIPKFEACLENDFGEQHNILHAQSVPRQMRGWVKDMVRPPDDDLDLLFFFFFKRKTYDDVENAVLVKVACTKEPRQRLLASQEKVESNEIQDVDDAVSVDVPEQERRTWRLRWQEWSSRWWRGRRERRRRGEEDAALPHI